MIAEQARRGHVPGRYLPVLALAISLLACQPMAATDPASTSPGATSSPKAAPIGTAPVAIRDVGFDRYRWQQASISIEPRSILTSVGSTPFGWVVAGTRINVPSADATFAPDSDPLAMLYSGVIWQSDDGRAWARHADGAEFDGARMTKVIANGTGALAFGLAGICLPDACGGLPPNGGTIVWSSSDSETWERLADTGLADGATTDVTEAGDGLIAVGYVANSGSKPDTDPFSNPTDAAVWRSADGRHWTAVSDLPMADRLSRVSADGSSVIALGSRGPATVTWTSADGGVSWSEGPALEDDCCSNSAIRDGLVVVASADGTAVRPDGVVSTTNATSGSWKRVLPPQMRGYDPAQVQVLGASIVIFGWKVHRDADDLLVADLPVAFSSLDGVTWVRTRLPEAWSGQRPISVAGRGHELVTILGPLESPNGPSESLAQTVWVGTAPD